MRKHVLVAIGLVPVLAHAEPRFEVIDRGAAVEVIAHDLKAARTAILPVRSRLEIPLDGHPAMPRMLPTDATVKLVELEDGNLSVKTGFDHPDVISLARVAQAIQVGPDLHVILPRAIPAPGAAVSLPEPTLPPELAAKAPAPSKIEVIEPPKPAAAPPPPPAPAPAAKPVAAAVRPAPPAPPASPVPPAPAAPAKQPLKTAPESETDWSSTAMALVFGGLTLGGGLWILKRKKRNDLPASTIEIVAQRSLGGKARVVWLAAGERELIVAVTPQSVRALGQWRKTQATGTAPLATIANDAVPLPVAQIAERSTRHDSPAVAGILRLREKTVPPIPQINAEVATDDADADALWAREILAATRSAR